MIDGPIGFLGDPEVVISGVELALFTFILLTAIATAVFRDVLTAVIVFAAYSLGMAIFYTVLLAPDVAMTEAAIGAGVTTIFLVLTLARTDRPEYDQLFEQVHWPGVVAVSAFVGVLMFTLADFPAVGDPEALAWANPVTEHYHELGYRDTEVENAVTAVLAGYRGFDTFGEAVVVFSAGIAVLVVLKTEVFTRE